MDVLVNPGRLLLPLVGFALERGQQIVNDADPLVDKTFEPLRVRLGHIFPEPFVCCPVAEEVGDHLRLGIWQRHQFLQALLSRNRVSYRGQLVFVQEVCEVGTLAGRVHVGKDALHAGHVTLGRGAGQALFGFQLCDLFNRVVELMESGAANVDVNAAGVDKGNPANGNAVERVRPFVVVCKYPALELGAQSVGNPGDRGGGLWSRGVEDRG